MPFTFSHPALILPFFKIRHASLSMSALVVGSIAPDFEYFIKMKLSGRYSHTLEGMFLLDIPIAILIWLVFHLLVKDPLIQNLPIYLKSRLFSLGNFHTIKYLKSHFLMLLFFLLIGIASHIMWDSFTHANSYFVDRLDFLSRPIEFTGFPTFPFFRYLQHFSTGVGALFIIMVFHRLPAYSVTGSISYRFWIVMFLVSIVTFMIRASVGFEYFGDIVTTVISSSFVGLITASIFTRLVHG